MRTGKANHLSACAKASIDDEAELQVAKAHLGDVIDGWLTSPSAMVAMKDMHADGTALPTREDHHEVFLRNLLTFLILNPRILTMIRLPTLQHIVNGNQHLPSNSNNSLLPTIQARAFM